MTEQASGESHDRKNHFRSPSRGCRPFPQRQSRNVAVIFGIAAVPLLSFVGAAIDYSRANSGRSSTQRAVDFAALMVSKDLTGGTILPSDTRTKAQAYFTALYTNKDAQSDPVNATYTAASGSIPATVLIKGSGAEDRLHEAGRFPSLNFKPSRPRPGATRACGSRWCWITPDRWPQRQDGGPANSGHQMITTLSSYRKKAGDV